MKRKATATTTRLAVKCRRLNDAYKKATPIERRKMIATDCLAQIEAERFIPASMVFTEVVLGTMRNGNDIYPEDDEPLQPLLHKPGTHCECCGVGAVFLSYVRLANKATAEDGNSVDDIQRVTDWPEDNLKLIELAFEKGMGTCCAYLPEEIKAVEFGKRFNWENKETARLKAILNNIIKAPDGLFHP